MIIYIDLKLLSPSGRRRAVQETQALADGHLKAGGRVVVVAEGGHLRPLTPVTANPGEVHRALGRIGELAIQSPGADHEKIVYSQFEAIVRIRLPLDALRFEDSAEGRQARVRVVVALRSPDSGQSRKPAVVREKEFTIASAAATTPPTSSHDVVLNVPVDGSNYDFAVGIEDIASGVATSLRRALGPANGSARQANPMALSAIVDLRLKVPAPCATRLHPLMQVVQGREFAGSSREH